MNALVIGGGLQGKAVVHDLSHSPLIEQITVVDIDLSSIRSFHARSTAASASANTVASSRTSQASDMYFIFTAFGSLSTLPMALGPSDGR